MSSPRERRQLPTPWHPAGTPTMRMTPPVRERRPPVGTARRRRANHAMLLSPMAQTAPAISLQIGRVPASTIRATGTPGRRQPGWRAGQGTPASSPGGGFTPAPPRAAGREGVTPTAKKREDGLERRPPVGTRWPPASARRIGKRRCGSPLGTCPSGRRGRRSAFPCLQVAPPGGLGSETCTIPELHFHDWRGVRADPIMDVSLGGGLRAPAILSTDC